MNEGAWAMSDLRMYDFFLLLWASAITVVLFGCAGMIVIMLRNMWRQR